MKFLEKYASEIWYHPAQILIVLCALFCLSWTFYLYSILEYKIYKIRMIQLLLNKLNAKIREIAKAHNYQPEQVEIAYTTNEGFMYRIYNDSGEVEKEATFKP